MIATVILAIGAAGVLLPFTIGAAERAEGQHRTLASRLAADLMEEILSTPFEYIVSSYGSYSEPQGEVKDWTEAEFTDPAYMNFARDASCTTEANFIQATVRVYYKGAEVAVINRLISE